ncbi:hypothetical protein [Plantactinospora endophytica]|uniref:hypothetical protein n=1 Tax=Plantactinospora endophytica TaxID=673535 RepID=UPI0019447804|nr:hypothetical protein [Plantactinospora endophytica]
MRRRSFLGTAGLLTAVTTAVATLPVLTGPAAAADPKPAPTADPSTGAAPQGGARFSVLAVEPGPAITRSEILARARTWDAVSYSQERYHNGYRTDCSGYVSMAWNLPESLNTGNLDEVSNRLSSYNDLRPGDILMYHIDNPWEGHVVIFAGWVGAVGGDFHIHEQTPPHTKHRTWSAAGYSRSLYKPYRYKNVIDDVVNSGVGAVVHDNLLRTFARGADGALWQYYWDGTGWKTQDLGRAITSGPSALVDGGTLRVFARGSDGALWQNYLVDGRWTWQRIGGAIVGQPAAVAYGGVLRVFARGADGALWQYYWSGGEWRTQDLGGGITSGPTAVVQGDVLRVFARGEDGALWQNYWANGKWTWQDLGGGITSAPSAVLHGQVLRVFARGNDGALWQNYYSNGAWAWQDLGGTITSAPSGVMHGSVLRVFARGKDTSLWQNYWANGEWTWQDLGGAIT